MNDQNHHVETQSRIASIIVERVIDNLGGSHTLGDVERKVKLYNSLHTAFRNEGLLEGCCAVPQAAAGVVPGRISPSGPTQLRPARATVAWST